MTEFQLTHIALVGARMSLFQDFGYTTRYQLALRPVAPAMRDSRFSELAPQQLRTQLARYLPLWIHNCIVDQNFPGRARLLMHLRRFEGELRENKNNEVIAEVLSSGFKNQTLDPLCLPSTMSTRRRCAMLVHIDPWKAAYTKLEAGVTGILLELVDSLDAWIDDTKRQMKRRAIPV